MDPSSVLMRAAKPAHDEGLVFARYLDEAAEGFFRFILGQRSDQILAAAFARPQHDLSFQNVTFAECDGVIRGMVSGYSAEQHRLSSLQPLMQAAGRRNLRIRVVRMLFAPVFHAIDSLEDGDYYLLAIAVDKQRRGRGLGSVLMDFFEKRAGRSGMGRLCLDVSAGNVDAIRFYESHGMAIESQWPKRLKIPGLKFYRMAKELG